MHGLGKTKSVERLRWSLISVGMQELRCVWEVIIDIRHKSMSHTVALLDRLAAQGPNAMPSDSIGNGKTSEGTQMGQQSHGLGVADLSDI